jgi:hypothetical protein
MRKFTDSSLDTKRLLYKYFEMKKNKLFIKTIATFATSILIISPFANSAGMKKAVAISQQEANSDTYNFKFSPLSLLVGGLNGGVDIRLNSDWTIGAEANYLSLNVGRSGSLTKDISVKSFGFGARANWFKNGVYTDGLYASPAISYQNASASSADSTGTITAEANGLFIKALVGYGWYWTSFNQMLGAGLSQGFGNTKVKVKDSTGATTSEVDISSSFALEYNLGWTF